VDRCGTPDGLAFIFDLDGVVIDSMPMHTEAWRVYLERHQLFAEDLVARVCMGDGTMTSFPHFSEVN
jgi:beta-phosphoglucomutase-like phosphatase (HAD superfamily)